MNTCFTLCRTLNSKIVVESIPTLAVGDTIPDM